jgi:transglutaminase-like putative cysteine protease
MHPHAPTKVTAGVRVVRSIGVDGSDMTRATTLSVLGNTRLRIVHRTRFQFAETLPTCELRTYLNPRDNPYQRVISHEVSVSPHASTRWQSHDDHGNQRDSAIVKAPEDGELREVEITSVSTLDVTQPTPAVVVDSPWEAVAEVSQGRHFWPYLLPSIGIPAGSAIDGYAQLSFRDGCSLGEGICTLLERVKRDFDSPVSDTHSNPQRLLAQRRGRAEDMTNFTVACLRAMGLPTRYLRGYAVRPIDGDSHMHCWASVWTGDAWLDIDPAQGRIGRLGHILVARGRDAAELAPVTARAEGGSQCWRQTEVLLREAAFEPLPFRGVPAA